MSGLAESGKSLILAWRDVGQIWAVLADSYFYAMAMLRFVTGQGMYWLGNVFYDGIEALLPNNLRQGLSM